MASASAIACAFNACSCRARKMRHAYSFSLTYCTPPAFVSGRVISPRMRLTSRRLKRNLLRGVSLAIDQTDEGRSQSTH